MLKKSILPFFIAACVLFLMQSSCSIEKRRYNTGYNLSWNRSEKSNHVRVKAAPNETTSEAKSVNQNDEAASVAPANETIASLRQDPILPNAKSAEVKKVVAAKKSDECDVIVLNEGDDLEVKVLEVSDTEVKYKQCSNLNGPTYTLSTEKISKIKYANGDVEYFKSKSTKKPSEKPHQNTHKKFDFFGLASLIAAGAAYVVLYIGLIAFITSDVLVIGIAGFLLALAAVIFGIANIVRIVKEPEVYKNTKGMGIGGIIAGSILLLLAILLALAIL